jgi:hypothetical protein
MKLIQSDDTLSQPLISNAFEVSDSDFGVLSHFSVSHVITETTLLLFWALREHHPDCCLTIQRVLHQLGSIQPEASAGRTPFGQMMSAADSIAPAQFSAPRWLVVRPASETTDLADDIDVHGIETALSCVGLSFARPLGRGHSPACSSRMACFNSSAMQRSLSSPPPRPFQLRSSPRDLLSALSVLRPSERLRRT